MMLPERAAHYLTQQLKTVSRLQVENLGLTRYEIRR